MHVKIQGGGKTSGIHANTGSCAALVEYLLHEDEERQARGKEVFPFFTAQGTRVTPEEVIRNIDRNHKKLCRRDAKFYHLDINPSVDEIPYLGTTDAEIVANGIVLCEKFTDIYAKNFKHAKISGGEDIMVFFKPHFTREKGEDLEFHIHGIVSRKDIHNRVKISPMSKHRGTSKGPVKGGFDREEFVNKIELAFDEVFHYPRRTIDTFVYKLAMKKGSVEDRANQESRLSSEESREINTKQAEEIIPNVSQIIHNALARIDARRRNEYWEKYHSELKTRYDSLKATCDRSFQLYRIATDKYAVFSPTLSEKFAQLHDVFNEMNLNNDAILRSKTAKGACRAILGLVYSMDPVASSLVQLVGGIITEANATAATQIRQILQVEALSIKTIIENLQEEQCKLKAHDSVFLGNYHENKEQRAVFKKEYATLESELKKHIPEERVKESSPDYAKRYGEHLAKKGEATDYTSNSLARAVSAYARKDEILSIFREAESSETLTRAMANHQLSFAEETNSNGVADITITAFGERPFTIKVSKFGVEYARLVLDAYEKATRHRLAYKVENSVNLARTVRIAKQTSHLIEKHNIESRRRQELEKVQEIKQSPGTSLSF